MKKITVIITLLLLTSACTVMVKTPTPEINLKLKSDNGLHLGQYK